MNSRRASRRSSVASRRANAASEAALSQRLRVGRKTIAGNKLYEPSAANKVAGGISGMLTFIFFQWRNLRLPIPARTSVALCSHVVNFRIESPALVQQGQKTPVR